MGGFDRRDYLPTKPVQSQSRYSFGADVARPLMAAAVVGLIVFTGYKILKSVGADSDAAANNAQLVQIGQKLDELEHRLDQLDKKRKTFKEVSEPAPQSPVITETPKPVPPKSQLAFSRPVIAQSAPSPAIAVAKPSPESDSTVQKVLNSKDAEIASSNQQWEATADRIGSVVGELDSQRDAIERDQARLDELAGRFARNSQSFTLEKGSNQQKVGPVWLQLQATDPRYQRYTMRLSVDDKTVVLKDRALHEAIQFYASGGKLSFELVVSQIQRDAVAGRLVLPQTIATR